MKPLFSQLDSAWRARRPSLAARLRPPADAAELRAHEDWPEVLREMHAWHDGCSDPDSPFEGVFGWPRLAELAAFKRMLDELETDGDFTSGGWQPGSWWNLGWFPVLVFNNSELVCFDGPGFLGCGEGAIFVRYNSDPRRTVLAPDLETWLRMQLRLTELGPAGEDDDAWIDWFNGDEDEVRAEIAPGYPRHVRAK